MSRSSVSATLATALFYSGTAAGGQPIVADMRLEQIVMAPTKAAGSRPWDGSAALSGSVGLGVEALAAVKSGGLTMLKAGEIQKQVAAVTGSFADAPDIYGSMELVQGGQVVERASLYKSQDQFMPTPHKGWTGCTRDVGLKVYLKEKDLTSDDNVGSFYLSPSDIQAAVDAGGTTIFIGVGAQTGNNVLMVGISATPILANGLPSAC